MSFPIKHGDFLSFFVCLPDRVAKIVGSICRPCYGPTPGGTEETGEEQRTSGEIVNLMAVDSQRLQDAMTYMHTLWSGPYQIPDKFLLSLFLSCFFRVFFNGFSHMWNPLDIGNLSGRLDFFFKHRQSICEILGTSPTKIHISCGFRIINIINIINIQGLPSP